MDYEVKDKVECLLNGKGEVKMIRTDCKYRVEVYFKDKGVTEWYTIDGKIYEEDNNPVLKKI